MLPDFRVRQRDYLLEISRALTEELDLDTLLTRILNISVEMLSGHAGFIALRDEQEGWRVVIHQGIPQALLSYLQKWLASMPTGGSDGMVSIPEINRMLNDISMGMLTGVGISMLVQNEAIGQIYVFRNYRAAFSVNDQIILRNFANQAAIAVRNARLYNQIREQNLRMTALLNSVADGILILKSDLTVENINPTLARLLKVDETQVEGQHYSEVLRWSKPPQGVPLEKAIENNGLVVSPEERYLEGDLLRPGGLQPLPVVISYAPVYSARGRLLNIIATVHDITRFRTADEMKSSFISVVSHELKTPISLIKGYASTLRREDAQWDPAMMNESLAVIEEEADRLAAMVEDLLEATRLQSGTLNIRLCPVDLHDLARELAERFSHQASSHHFSVDFPDDFPVISADEDRMVQLISNLISNALKYSEKGEIRISGNSDGQRVQVCVSDEGKGFDPADLPFVFDRFYRSESAIKTTKGTGLGLYLCRAIVEAHGGQIWVDQTYQKGAKICFWLPLEQPASEAQ